MKVRTYRDEKSGKVGIVLIPEFCCEEETLINELTNNKVEIITATNPFTRGLALVMDKNKVSQFSAIENSKGNRFHLRPFREQKED